MENIDTSIVDWSRWQFALTAIYHWLFVPLTLGLGIIIGIMETNYYRTKLEYWKTITKFWMRLFGINFAIGVATGLILEFEFGTNWSNYSWFVGDIFGAPLAIEGIFAFFIEATFMAVMFFGWNKVSPKFHLISTWLVAFGASLSAFWILVANAWMQDPVGMQFNPETMRNEMVSFWEIVSSPMAIYKFTHTVSSSFMLGSAFVIGISSWFLLKKRNEDLAVRSIKIASIFGIIAFVLTAFTGDGSAYTVSQKQPMKLAAMEGLYEGNTKVGLSVIGILTPSKEINDNKESHILNFEIPGMLSLLANRDINSFVPGIEDLINGNLSQNILSTNEKISRGKIAVETLREYKIAKQNGDQERLEKLSSLFDRTTSGGQVFYENYFQYFGYGYIKKATDTIPNVPLVFYSFRIMILFGTALFLIFVLCAFWVYKVKKIMPRLLLYFCILGIPMAYIASILGWVVAEVGRQPWVIQDTMPTNIAVSSISSQAVQTTFWIFAVLFTVLLFVEIKIMIKQIKKG